MTWMENFYLSENITDNRKAIKRKINWTRNVLEYYLLAVSSSKDDSVDIIPALEFKSLPDRKKSDMTIIGVSSGYHNAKKMADEYIMNVIVQS